MQKSMASWPPPRLDARAAWKMSSLAVTSPMRMGSFNDSLFCVSVPVHAHGYARNDDKHSMQWLCGGQDGYEKHIRYTHSFTLTHVHTQTHRHTHAPVLSEHRMVMPASSSMADRRATMTFDSASRREPTASVDVHTISMAMGMDATRMTMQLEMAEMNLDGSFFVGTGVIVGVSDVSISLICGEAAKQPRRVP
jgi:hypothetical protein